MKGITKILLILVVCILLAAAFFQVYRTNIGSNSTGYVTKQVDAYPLPHQTKIAVITGMHPRELHATDVVPKAALAYALQNNAEIDNYQVTVTDEPRDFNVGRANGQALVAGFVNPDIIRSNYSLVIICHDHESGYGSGYYFATPTHDSKSIALGNKVASQLSNFNYYSGSSSTSYEASSISQVDLPLTTAGIPVFVYEIPENDDNNTAYTMTYNLLNASFKALSSR
jgi:hypothetical protein